MNFRWQFIIRVNVVYLSVFLGYLNKHLHDKVDCRLLSQDGDLSSIEVLQNEC